MSYDRRRIMQNAWNIARQEHWSRRLGDGQLRELFPEALRCAWHVAKMAAAYEARVLSESAKPSAEISAEILDLENRSRLNPEDFRRLSEMKRAHSEARMREASEAMNEKRELIASAGSRFCAVTFIKKDGTARRMRVQPASLRLHVKGEAATDAGRKGAETRAARHPHLMPVWDAEKKAIRSVNLETVTRIAVGGRVHEFAA